MLPVITLVGRPNVGKSTLFNRLTQSRDALVANFPGLTRDRQYGVGRVGPNPYVVVDTGGISFNADGVEALMQRQVQAALDVDQQRALAFALQQRAAVGCCQVEELDLALRMAAVQAQALIQPAAQAVEVRIAA